MCTKYDFNMNQTKITFIYSNQYVLYFFDLAQNIYNALNTIIKIDLTSRANLIFSSRIRFIWPYMNVLCQLISFWSLESNTSFDK